MPVVAAPTVTVAAAIPAMTFTSSALPRLFAPSAAVALTAVVTAALAAAFAAAVPAAAEVAAAAAPAAVWAAGKTAEAVSSVRESPLAMRCSRNIHNSRGTTPTLCSLMPFFFSYSSTDFRMAFLP